MNMLLRILLALALSTSVAFGAVTPNNIVVPQALSRGVVQFTSSDVAGTYKTLFTAGANGSRCNGMYSTTSDTTNHLLTLQVQNSGIKYGGTAWNAGTLLAGYSNGVATVGPLLQNNNIIWPLPLDADGNAWFYMNNGDSLVVTFATAITAATKVNVVVFCMDY